MRLLILPVFLVIACATAWAEDGAVPSINDPTASQVANNPDPELMVLYGNLVFLEGCVASQPKWDAVDGKLSSLSHQAMPDDVVALGVKSMALDTWFKGARFGERVFKGNFFLSEEMSTAGSVIVVEGIHGYVEYVHTGRSATICSIGVPGASPEDLTGAIEELLGVGPNKRGSLRRDDGFNTQWITWDKLAPTSPVFSLHVLVPEQPGDPSNIIPRLLAMGLD